MTEINTHGMILTQKDSAKKGFESVVVFLGGDENEESRGKEYWEEYYRWKKGVYFEQPELDIRLLDTIRKELLGV